MFILIHLLKIKYLYIGFSDALTAYHDTNLDPKIRPEKYESKVVTSAWGKNNNGVPSAWGQQQPQQPNNGGKLY